MQFAIFKFGNPQRGLLHRLAGFLLSLLNLTVQLFIADNFVHQNIGHLAVAVEKVLNRSLDRFDNRPVDVGIAQLVFSLRLEYRVFKFYRYRPRHPVAHFVGLI